MKGSDIMKKKLVITIGIMLVTVVLGIAFYQSDASQIVPGLSADEIEQLVTEQYPGTITDTKLDEGLNKVIYDVSVTNDRKEYHLKLDGNTGEILKLEDKGLVNKEQMAVDDQDKTEKKVNNIEKKQEKTDDKKTEKIEEDKKEQKEEKKKEPKPEQKTVIDAQEAINIALKEFPGTVDSYELDDDDGRLIYEIEIESSKGEAEFEIDAYTGEILVIDIELDDDDD